MESDSEPVEQTFDQAKKKSTIKVAKRINKKPKKAKENLFDEQVQSSNTASQFSLNKQNIIDQSFQKNLEEELPEILLKQVYIKPDQENQTITLQQTEHKIKKINNIVVETKQIKRVTNPKANAAKATSFLQKQIFDSVPRKPIQFIVNKKK